MVEINKIVQEEEQNFEPITPKAEHIDYLLANPETALQFDEKYGEGASLKYLPTKKEEDNLEEQKAIANETLPPSNEVGVVEDVLKSGVAGVQEGIQETFETLEGLSDTLEDKFSLGGFVLGKDAENGVIQYLGPDEFRAKTQEINEREGEDKGLFQSVADLIPESREAETTAGGVTKGVTQFLTGFAGAKKVTSTIKGYNKVNKFIRSTIEGGIADFTVFDEHEARLSDFIIEHVPEAESSFIGYLASDENDTFYEGKLKNALEGGLLGTVADGTFRLVKYINDVRKARATNNLTEAQKIANQRKDEILNDLKNVSEEEFQYLSKVNRGLPVNLKPKIGRPSREELNRIVTDGDYVKTITEGVRKVRLGEIDPDEAFDIPLNIKKMDGGEAIQDLSDVITVTKAVFDNVKKLREIGEDPQGFDEILRQSNDLIEEPIDTITRSDKFAKDLIEDGPAMLYSVGIIQKGLGRNYIQLAKKLNEGRIDQATVDNAQDLFVKTTELVKMFSTGSGRLLNVGNLVKQGDSKALKEVDKLIEQNRFKKLTAKERAQLHKRVAHVDNPRTLTKVFKDIATLRIIGIDKINEFFINAILSNPKTHAINMTSNLIVAITRPLEKMVGSGFGLFDRKAFREAVSTLAGMVKYHQLVVKATKEAMRRGDGVLVPGVNKVDLPENAIGGKFGEAVRMPTRFLTAEDEFFKGINYVGKAYSMAVSDGLAKNLSRKKNIRLDNGKMVSELDVHIEDYMDDIYTPSGQGRIPEALEYAQEQTFTKELGKETLGGRFQGMVNSFPLLRQITPFVRTPVNLFRYALDRSPVGFIRKNVRERLKNPETRSQAVGELLIGNSIIISLLTYANSDMITGGYDSNPNIRRQQMDSGWQPYSIIFNGKYYSYERLDPFAMLIGSVADYKQTFNDIREEDSNALAEAIQMTLYDKITSTAGNVGQAVAGGSMAVAKNLTNKVYLKGLADILEVIESGDPNKWNRYLRNKVASFSPAVLQAYRNDPLYRQTTSIADTIKTKYFGQEIDPSYNVMGEPRERNQSFVERLINPITIGELKGDIVLNEFNRLGVGFSPIRDSLGANSNIDLKKYSKDGVSAYRKYNELLGSVKINGLTLREKLEKEIQSKRYIEKLTDNVTTDGLTYTGSKQDFINKILKAYRKKAKGQLLKEGLTSENGLDLKKAVINDRKNTVFNKRGKNLLEIE